MDEAHYQSEHGYEDERRGWPVFGKDATKLCVDGEVVVYLVRINI